MRDYEGEGLLVEEVEFSLELDMKFGGQLNVKRVAAPRLRLAGSNDVLELYEAFEREYSDAYSPLGLNPDAGVEVDALILKARLRSEPAPLALMAEPERPGGPQGMRRAVWQMGEGPVDTPVFDAASLAAGAVVLGPALVEDETTTTAVAPGWVLTVDEYGTFLLTNEREEGK
jgi:N-methylhydantoinase A/acetophenone carboxylase